MQTSFAFGVRPVSFRSEGMLCRGRLYLPVADSPLPCVVLAHGFSGTMDWIVPDFAARFAAAGLAAMVFDYRHLGESDGTPRQLISRSRQLVDLRNAVDHVRTLPEIDRDRIALWGTSLGGSHVVTMAAGNLTISAVVANVPALDVWRGGGDVRTEMVRRGLSRRDVVRATGRLLGAAALDLARGWLGLSPHYIQVYGPIGRAVFNDPALAGLFRDMEANSATWRNQVTPRFLFDAPRYRRGTMERITAPLLVTLARDDTEVSCAFVTERAAKAPRCEIKVFPVGHFDMYHGTTFDEVSLAHCAFLLRHLGPESA